MPENKEFQAWIVSEGRTLREFHLAKDGKEVSCWIPCEVGKRFAVHWMDHGTAIQSAGYLSFDGHTASGRFLYGFGATQRDTIRIDKDHESPLYFAETEAPRRVSGSRSPGAGTIVLKIRLVKLDQPTHDPNPACSVPKPGATPSTGGVCVGFCQPERTSRQHDKTWRFKPYDPKDPSHYVRFVWRYRTEDFLLDQGIMGPEDTMYVEIPVVLTPHESEVQEGEASETEDKAAPGKTVAQQRTPPSSPHSSHSDTSVPTLSFTFIEYSPTHKKGKKSLIRDSVYNIGPSLPIPAWSSRGALSSIDSDSSPPSYYQPHVSKYSRPANGNNSFASPPYSEQQ